MGSHDVVLDVPGNAIAIALGVLLVGRGEALMADFQVEAVGEEVPTTNLYETRPAEPLNLDFSETGE